MHNAHAPPSRASLILQVVAATDWCDVAPAILVFEWLHCRYPYGLHAHTFALPRLASPRLASPRVALPCARSDEPLTNPLRVKREDVL